jgi:phosphatidylglycerophosphate synthase
MDRVHFVVVATEPAALERRLLGLTLLERHVQLAERAGADVVTVVCTPGGAARMAAAVRALGRALRVRVDALEPSEQPAALARYAKGGAAVLTAGQLLDARAAQALAARIRPGTLAEATDPAVRQAGLVAPLGSPAERRAAIRALCRTAYKPTDNFFARLNRRVSVPISRVLLRTHISPNAISLIGLAVSVLAGFAYARGGYGPMLAGAFLGWFSSMLDGCDGEVARLAFRESALGCWLESVCDDLYYLAVLIGMVVGLVRQGEAQLVWVLGILALVGFGATSILHLTLRARVAARSGPSSFARFFEERMAALGSDPVARFARATYKVGTRSTLPYLLLALGLVGQTRLALVAIAIGAHLYWAISLYLWLASPPVAASRAQ